MTTEAQIQANRVNAQKSTGPRSDQGKAIASQNALKHGLRSEQAVIVGEDVGEFEFYRERMLGDLAPEGASESMLAERVVSLSWRLRRAERAQNEAFDTLLARVAADPFQERARLPQEGNDNDDLHETLLGQAVVSDFADDRVLERLSMYERRIESSLYKTMSEFQKQRLTRALEPAPRPDPAPAEENTACAGEDPSRQTNPMCPETRETLNPKLEIPNKSEMATTQTLPAAPNEANSRSRDCRVAALLAMTAPGKGPGAPNEANPAAVSAGEGGEKGKAEGCRAT